VVKPPGSSDPRIDRSRKCKLSNKTAIARNSTGRGHGQYLSGVNHNKAIQTGNRDAPQSRHTARRRRRDIKLRRHFAPTLEFPRHDPKAAIALGRAIVPARAEAAAIVEAEEEGAAAIGANRKGSTTLL